MTTLYLIYLLYSLKVGLGVFWYEWLIFALLLILNPMWDLLKITYIKYLSTQNVKTSNNKSKDKETSLLGKIT